MKLIITQTEIERLIKDKYNLGDNCIIEIIQPQHAKPKKEAILNWYKIALMKMCRDFHHAVNCGQIPAAKKPPGTDDTSSAFIPDQQNTKWFVENFFHNLVE